MRMGAIGRGDRRSAHPPPRAARKSKGGSSDRRIRINPGAPRTARLLEDFMNRRSILRALGASLIAAGPRAAQSAGAPAKPVAELQRDWRLLLAKDARIAADATPVQRSDDEWRKTLGDDSYR